MSKLFEPVAIGSTRLGNRLAMAPMTRFRCDGHSVPTELVKEYYEQRANAPGALLITEATFISRKSTSARHTPGIWSEEQVIAWKKVTDAVHAKGSKIFVQLWHMGRAGDPDVLQGVESTLLSSSAIPITNKATPIPMTEEQIQDVIQDFAKAAKQAVAAGFDGVEIHGANGYLLDQFLQDTCNKRTDRWGGSIENRARLHFEVTSAVVEAIGAGRTGLRLSPYNDFQGMLMDDPEPTFRYLIEKIKPLGLAYLHLVDAGRLNEDDSYEEDKSIKWIVELWQNASPIVLTGGLKPASAIEIIDKTYQDYDIIIGFGRWFISNPDLAFRVQNGIPLTKYNRADFYAPITQKGYTDHPFSPEYLAAMAS